MTQHQMDALQPLHTIKPHTYIYQNARSLFKQIHWLEFELINKALNLLKSLKESLSSWK